MSGRRRALAAAAALALALTPARAAAAPPLVADPGLPAPLPANVQAAVATVLADFAPATVADVAAVELVPVAALPAGVCGQAVLAWAGPARVRIGWECQLEPTLIHELCHVQRWREAGDATHDAAFAACVRAHGGTLDWGQD